MKSHRAMIRMTISGTENPAPQLSRGRRRLFGLITFATPIVLLATLELLLQIFHYGPDLSLFISVQAGPHTYTAMNPEVSRRYFSRTEFSPATSLDVFVRPKPSGVFRVFCLGGSTTVGYPYYYNGAFSTFLRDRLHALFPERQIEVVNLGMTATNSFTVLDFARDLTGAGADLLVVYDGHNEFYGALGVASRESAGGARWLTDLSLRLLRLKSYALLRDTYQRVMGLFAPAGPEEDRGTMMERLARGKYVAWQSPLYREGLETFRGNLDALARVCKEQGIPLILSTQVSNVRSQAPFVSLERPGLSLQQRLQFNNAFNSGVTARLDGHPDSALIFLRSAQAIDSLRADVEFEIARCLDTLGRTDQARSSYMRARDLDELRFRTSSDFNDAIRAMENPPLIAVVDMERWFAGLSKDSIVGDELIFEHLHPRAQGAFLMGKAYTATIRRLNLIATEETWRARDTLDEQRLWGQRPLTFLDEMMARRKVEILTSGWPFKDQFPKVSAISEGDTLGQFVEQVTRARWTWRQAHEEALEYYRRRGDLRSVEAEFRAIICESPIDIQPRLKLARLYLEEGRLHEMSEQLRATLEVEPTILAYRALGDLALRSGSPAEAVQYYRNITPFAQSINERLQNGYLLGVAYARAGMQDSAEGQMHRLLELKPDFTPASEFLKAEASHR